MIYGRLGVFSAALTVVEKHDEGWMWRVRYDGPDIVGWIDGSDVVVRMWRR